MNTQGFLEALRQVEDQGNGESMVALFAEDAQIWNPEFSLPSVGRDGARQFWREYRDTFASVHSTFRSIVESDAKTALEWDTSGTLEANGQPFRYRGASVIDWSGDQIKRFAAYFDPRALAAASLEPVPVRRAENA